VVKLRVLVANERQDRLADVAAVVAGLGHEVIAPQIEVSEVGLVTAREQPDVALVGLGESSDHALELIEQIVHEAACPVVALLHAPDSEFVLEAARRGVFAYITDGEPQDWQNSIEIVLRRFADYRDLSAQVRRAGLGVTVHAGETGGPEEVREAVEALEAGTMARAAFGDDVVDHYLNYANTEQQLFDQVVTCYERERLFERG